MSAKDDDPADNEEQLYSERRTAQPEVDCEPLPEPWLQPMNADAWQTTTRVAAMARAACKDSISHGRADVLKDSISDDSSIKAIEVVSNAR